MFSAEPPGATVGLLGSLNSLVCDYVARQKLGGTSFKYFTMRQIAVLPPAAYGPDELAFVYPRVVELTYTSHSLSDFACDLGHNGPPFPWLRRSHILPLDWHL